ncbi:MAG TPA: hypothetical protein DEF51_55255 [Myxococcales bacterium]|nr:hypothetical protein [Myxococcales bacterium]
MPRLGRALDPLLERTVRVREAGGLCPARFGQKQRERRHDPERDPRPPIGAGGLSHAEGSDTDDRGGGETERCRHGGTVHCAMASGMPRPRRLWLVGEQRSGTRFATEVLCAFPGVETAGSVLQAPLRLASELGVGAGSALTRRERLALTRSMRHPGDGERLFEASEEPSLDALLCRRFGWRHPGAVWVVSKDHGPFEWVPRLLAETDFTVIALVRDLRDVVLSRWTRGEEALDGVVSAWKRSARQLADLSHPRLLALRFEDLMIAPEQALRRVGQLLDREVSLEQTIAATEAWSHLRADSSHGDVRRPFEGVAVERWRRHGDAEWVKHASVVAADELRLWGYEVPRAPVGDVVQAWRRYARAELLRGARVIATRARRRALPPMREPRPDAGDE